MLKSNNGNELKSFTGDVFFCCSWFLDIGTFHIGGVSPSECQKQVKNSQMNMPKYIIIHIQIHIHSFLFMQYINIRSINLPFGTNF